MFQGLLWPHLRPSPAPRPTSREVARAALVQPPRSGAAGAEHPGALAVPRPGPRGGPARGLLPGPRLSLCCPESGGTGRVLAACRLPAKSWEPGEQADPWDQEPAAFPAPPTHSPGPALPAGLWGRQPAQPCPALPSGFLAGGRGGLDSLSAQGWGLHGPQEVGWLHGPVHNPLGQQGCAGSWPPGPGTGQFSPSGAPFLPSGRPEAPLPPGCQRALGWTGTEPSPEPPGQGTPAVGRQSAAPRSAWEPDPQGSRVPGLLLWEAGGGGAGTGFSSRRVGWGGGRALRAYRGGSGHQPWELWHRWFPRVWPGPCGWHHVCLLP